MKSCNRNNVTYTWLQCDAEIIKIKIYVFVLQVVPRGPNWDTIILGIVYKNSKKQSMPQRLQQSKQARKENVQEKRNIIIPILETGKKVLQTLKCRCCLGLKIKC